MSRPSLHAFLALLSAATCAIAVSACGDDSEAAGMRADAVLDQAVGSDARPASSGRLDASLVLDAREITGRTGAVRIKLGGPFAGGDQRGLPRLDLALDADLGGRRVRGGAISTGERAYLRLGGRTYAVSERLLGQLRTALALVQGRRGLTLGALGLDPSRWITDPQLRGTETVGGAQATHVSGGLDEERFLDDIDTLLGRAKLLGALLPFPTPDRLPAAVRERIAEAIRDARVDVWAGERDRILRRLKVAAGVGRSGRLALDLLIADVGEPQEIREPQDARPLSELAGGGLLGSLAEPSP